MRSFLLQHSSLCALLSTCSFVCFPHISVMSLKSASFASTEDLFLKDVSQEWTLNVCLFGHRSIIALETTANETTCSPSWEACVGYEPPDLRISSREAQLLLLAGGYPFSEEAPCHSDSKCRAIIIEVEYSLRFQPSFHCVILGVSKVFSCPACTIALTHWYRNDDPGGLFISRHPD
ncbi:hypothetical protein AX14_013788 [Amanita brunnescens Koide BX004]|nr:hypothetical protein AX14_013788 [Amanita brunnescens Koide BX004]